MKILLTFIGNNDCYPNEKPGAVLSILSQVQFDKVYLFYNNDRFLKSASELNKYCKTHFPTVQICYKEVPAVNPTEYNIVYPAMYAAVKAVQRENQKASYTISLTSGTPTMHSCWIFLVKGRIIDADMIQISRDGVISDVSLELDDFPQINAVEEIKTTLTRLSRENKKLKEKFSSTLSDFIGESAQISKIKEEIKLVADTDLPVFISGESGTGKELVASNIHFSSSRKEKIFLPVNCGAIPENLIESELFGHLKGSFTGATADKEGLFECADGGTIFLDEIGDLPLTIQVKLLRVIESGEFKPVGSSIGIQVDVRIISATNKNIRELVKTGDFREDLFYRIVNIEIELPPLRMRGTDKILIANTILQDLNVHKGLNKKFEQSALDLILEYSWPGNIRQLKNTVKTAYIYSSSSISAEHMHIIEIEPAGFNIVIPDEGLDLDNTVIPAYYEAALKKTGGNAESAAKLLGIKPHTFRARLKARRK